MKNIYWIIEVVVYFILIFILKGAFTFLTSNQMTFFLGQIVIILGYAGVFFFILNKMNVRSITLGLLFQKIIGMPFSINEMLWILSVFIGGVLSYGMLSRIPMVMQMDVNPFPIIYTIPGFNSGFKLFTIVIIFKILVAIFAEELFFRGYLFSKQCNTLKRSTWIVNGFTWSLTNILTPANFIAIIPTGLLLAFAYQKKKNLRITIVANALMTFMLQYNLILTYLS